MAGFDTDEGLNWRRAAEILRTLKLEFGRLTLPVNDHAMGPKDIRREQQAAQNAAMSEAQPACDAAMRKGERTTAHWTGLPGTAVSGIHDRHTHVRPAPWAAPKDTAAPRASDPTHGSRREYAQGKRTSVA